MKEVEYNGDNEDNQLKSLLSSSKKSLERKIRELTRELENRQKISNNILTTLQTAKLQLEDKLWRLRYSSMFNEAFIVNRDFMRQIQRIEEQISAESISNFQDTLKLKIKLQEITEELDLEYQKLKLLEFD